MKDLYATPEGKEISKKSHEKRSETMAKKREEIRATITQKLCKRCETVKSVCEFSVKSQATDGYQSWCKICTIENKQKNIKIY